MTSLNKFTGIGRLGKDPNTTSMPNGTTVSNISMAFSETYKDKNGDKKETTEWINVVFFGKLAEIVDKYLQKGSLIYIEGKVKTDKYVDRESGVEKYSTKIVADSMKMISTGEKSTKNESRTQRREDYSNAFDDEIPF